jgi:hypothetical protein
MGTICDHGLDTSAAGSVQKESGDDCESFSFQESLSKRTTIGYAHADLFHQSRGAWAQQIATRRIGARQATALETSAANASTFTSIEIDNGVQAPLGEPLAVAKASLPSSARVLDSPNAAEADESSGTVSTDDVAVRPIGK